MISIELPTCGKEGVGRKAGGGKTPPLISLICGVLRGGGAGNLWGQAFSEWEGKETFNQRTSAPLVCYNEERHFGRASGLKKINLNK